MILSARNLSKTFRFPSPVPLFQDLSFDLEKGTSTAICGRSGEGKTTLLYILSGLEEADAGSVTLFGTEIKRENAARLRLTHIGFIFQAFHLFEDFSVLENVLMPARILRRPINRKFGLSLLEKVGLLPRADFPAKLLSGGERQRVAIARALCNNPELLMADEPSGNLDQKTADEIGTLLLSLVRQEGKSLLLVTHDPKLSSLCDKTAYLKGGRLSNFQFIS